MEESANDLTTINSGFPLSETLAIITIFPSSLFFLDGRKDPVSTPKELSKWNFEGSNTGQAAGHDSEVILYPQPIYPDPFQRGKHILVIYDTYAQNGTPLPTNKRHTIEKIINTKEFVEEDTWHGLEQEYTLLQKNSHRNFYRLFWKATKQKLCDLRGSYIKDILVGDTLHGKYEHTLILGLLFLLFLQEGMSLSSYGMMIAVFRNLVGVAYVGVNYFIGISGEQSIVIMWMIDNSDLSCGRFEGFLLLLVANLDLWWSIGDY
ncbi:hypothetical protein SUGI_0681020 [Cryptomeria japonica]|nr:hypothetical protein SUGI_0681020 [Cryptomeria japonica]